MATPYQPMTLVDLAGRLRTEEDERLRWRLVWEFMEEYRWEPAQVQVDLVRDEPAPGRRRTLGRPARRSLRAPARPA